MKVLKKKRGLQGRCSDDAHDMRFSRLQANLPQFINSGDIDELRLFRRQHTVQNNAKSGLVELDVSSENFCERYNEVVFKEIDTAGKAEYFTIGSTVVDLMRKRNASQEEIDVFNDNLQKNLQRKY